MNIAPTDIDIRGVLTHGHQALDKAHADRELTLRGLLRAGSSGCVHERRVYGECHRIAHLRLLGHDKPVEPNRKLMFQGGEGNEDLWAKVLGAGWQGQVHQGREFQREGEAGLVHGTTDIVLADASGNPTVLLELKLVCSLNTAIQRNLERKPDGKHLIQSAAYMWLTGLPAVLCYTSRTDFAVQFQAKKLGTSKIEPFYALFYLKLEDDTLWYRDEYEVAWRPTCVTLGGIEDYFKMVRAGELGPRPENGDVEGGEGYYNRCDAKYCAYSETCDRWEHDYTTWVDAAKRV